MATQSSQLPVSKAAFWTGWVLSILPALFLLMDAVMKLIKPDFVIEGTVKMGYPEGAILPLGIVLLICTVLYLLPPTAVLGAILLTGYLGGAVATHVRHEDPTWQIFFPAIFGALLWLGLVLREPRLRSLVPWRSQRGA
jgi:DoxX-like protein